MTNNGKEHPRNKLTYNIFHMSIFHILFHINLAGREDQGLERRNSPQVSSRETGSAGTSEFL